MIELKPLFTTQEQSKTLLELGVPRDTADLKYVPQRTFNSYFLADPADGLDDSKVFYPNEPTFNGTGIREYDIPCWSIGRLFQILSICYDHPRCTYVLDMSMFPDMESMIGDIEYNVKNGMVDFSKLNN
jgi:hypothetical protein